jgi:hypothetical protein
MGRDGLQRKRISGKILLKTALNIWILRGFLFLFVSYYPRWRRQVQMRVAVAGGVIALNFANGNIA